MGPDYRFVELAAGHWLPETHPDEVAVAILDGVRATRDMLDRFNAISMELGDPAVWHRVSPRYLVVEVVGTLFPGGHGRCVLTDPEPVDASTG